MQQYLYLELANESGYLLDFHYTDLFENAMVFSLSFYPDEEREGVSSHGHGWFHPKVTNYTGEIRLNLLMIDVIMITKEGVLTNLVQFWT